MAKKPVSQKKPELKEVEDYLSVGAHLHISRKAWLMYVIKKLPSGTRPRSRKRKLVVAATMFPGQKVVSNQYSETLQKSRLHRTTSSR